jgi:hypothetical protein
MKKKIQIFMFSVLFLIHVSVSSNKALGSYTHTTQAKNYVAGDENQANFLAVAGAVVLGVVYAGVFVAGVVEGYKEAAKAAGENETQEFEESSDDFSKFDTANGSK